MSSFGNRPYRLFAMLLAAGFALSLTGCVGRFTGGGFIDSANGAPKKATFGFVIDAVEPDEFGNPTAVLGQFQFNDHAAGVKFHVNQLEPALYARIYPDFFNPEAVMFAYHGTYTCEAGSGELDLGVSSDQQSFFDSFDGTTYYNQDAVFISVVSGPYAGYENAGVVQGGKIQFSAGE